MHHALMKATMSELEEAKARLQTIIADSPEPPACGCIPAFRSATARWSKTSPGL
ncbi:hypothetical protein METH_16255 [Leisingera methylohalidivorans DSM 14336]|uniref:Uncharacterized protein n=1 Tax=Leisingera methylohalidivorans DSM 14336 TaxID=999552 RepID=V9VZH1_9RHOB|nr:hypothetical protein METH_16255 [Leisingera methylohalidivorans DSM 14336]